MLFIGALLIALFYLRPAWSKTVTQTRENRDLRSLNDELNSLIENRDFLLDTINRISRNDLSRVDEVLPKDRQAARLLALFESLSGKSGLVLKSIELSEKVEVKAESPGQPRPGLGITPPKPSGPVREFPISMSMLGTYDSFKNFMGMLERNLRVSDIDNLNFSITGTTDLFSFSLKLKTYYQP
jgi:hypothetical protein